MVVIDTCTATRVSPWLRMCTYVRTYVDVGVDAVSVGVTVVCVKGLARTRRCSHARK